MNYYDQEFAIKNLKQLKDIKEVLEAIKTIALSRKKGSINEILRIINELEK